MAEEHEETTDQAPEEASEPEVQEPEVQEPEAAAEPEAAPEAEEDAPEAEEQEEMPVAEAEEPAPAEEPAVEAAEQARRKRKRVPRGERRRRAKPKRERPAERKPIVRLPKPEAPRGASLERRGVVVSSAMDKTIVVRVETVKSHPRYKKIIRRSSKFHAHDERNEAKVGDTVRIVEARPISKTKRWRLAEILEVAK